MIGVSVLSILAASAVLSVQATDFDITYTCNPGGLGINLGNLDGNVTYKAAVGLASTSTADRNCLSSFKPVANNALNLINCTSPGKLVLYLMEPQGPFENDIGVGKIYTYEIDCQSLTVNGTLTVNSTDTPIPLEPTIKLTMSITPNPMYLGQEVKVTITESSGSVNHLLNLTSCTAASSDHNQTVTLVSDGNITHTDLVKDITPGNGTVAMTLYGFRFMKDPNVELTCTVKVCASSAKKCQSASTTGRKRETIPVHSSSLHIVSGSFRVISDQEPQ